MVTGTEGIGAAAERLGALADDLGRRGLAAQVVKGGGYPYVSVVNRMAAALCETIFAAPAEDGTWWFWWSWADRIAPVDDVEVTASRVCCVLTTHD